MQEHKRRTWLQFRVKKSSNRLPLNSKWITVIAPKGRKIAKVSGTRRPLSLLHAKTDPSSRKHEFAEPTDVVGILYTSLPATVQLVDDN